MNLVAFILRRSLYTIPVLLGVTLMVFLVFNIFAGDPTDVLLGPHATVTQKADLRAELGLDRALYLQYIDIVKSAFTFDFGRSWVTKQTISKMISDGAVPSLSFSLPAFILSTFISICLALLVSFYRGKMIDKVVVFLTVSLMSISSLAYILFCQTFFAYKLGWFEISGYEFGFPYFLPYVALPIVIWLLVSVGPDIRFYRTVILDEIYQDYIRTARSKGLGEVVILFKHVLKNAMIPIITYVVIQIPFLILGALLIESFFGIPGLGSMTVDAINSNDFPVIKAMTILTAVSYIIFSLITDILYTLVDPRVRLK